MLKPSEPAEYLWPLTSPGQECRLHPALAGQPELPPKLAEELRESIALEGLKGLISVWDDEARNTLWILDGRSRLRALIELGIDIDPDESVFWINLNNDTAAARFVGTINVGRGLVIFPPVTPVEVVHWVGHTNQPNSSELHILPFPD